MKDERYSGKFLQEYNGEQVLPQKRSSISYQKNNKNKPYILLFYYTTFYYPTKTQIKLFEKDFRDKNSTLLINNVCKFLKLKYKSNKKNQIKIPPQKNETENFFFNSNSI